MKEIYTIPKMELKYAECEDIIKTSGEEDELPFVPTSELRVTGNIKIKKKECLLDTPKTRRM